MNSLEAVTAMTKYLAQNFTAMRFFKHVKSTAYTGEYIVVNALPFTVGSAQYNVINVNIHVPQTASGEVDSARITALQAQFEQLVPRSTDEEDLPDWLELSGAYFARECDSNPMSDADDTFFINNKVKVITDYE
jgi:hypothetical protein